jgi:hypothetical protein
VRRRRSFAPLVLGFVFGFIFGTGTAVAVNNGSVGHGHGIIIGSGGSSPCPPSLLNSNFDGSVENGYCWQYGGVVPPCYGAFAECTELGSGMSICGMQLLLTSIGNPVLPCDLYVWADAGGRPGNVLDMVPGVNPGQVATWPNVSVHDLAIDPIWVHGLVWFGYWSDYSNQPCGYFVAADTNGFGGCPYTNIAPGIGYPTGWNNVSVVWGRTVSIGIAVWQGGDPASGACCLESLCVRTTESVCTEDGGYFLGWGTTCNPDPCVPGACCLEDSCVTSTEYECAEDGGYFMGSGTTCDPNLCLLGACCLQNGHCRWVTPAECDGLGGTFLGHGTSCDPSDCPGACCEPWGACTITSQGECILPNIWHDGTVTCEPNPCPQPGACCLWDYCEILPEPQCDYENGHFLGNSTSCNPDPCPPTSSIDGQPAGISSGELKFMPNPSAGQVLILYRLTKAGEVALEIFNASGALVRRLTTGPQSAGAHMTRWDGCADDGRYVPAGVYLTRITTPEGTTSGRLVLAR